MDNVKKQKEDKDLEHYHTTILKVKDIQEIKKKDELNVQQIEEQERKAAEEA